MQATSVTKTTQLKPCFKHDISRRLHTTANISQSTIDSIMMNVGQELTISTLYTVHCLLFGIPETPKSSIELEEAKLIVYDRNTMTPLMITLYNIMWTRGIGTCFYLSQISYLGINSLNKVKALFSLGDCTPGNTSISSTSQKTIS